MRVIRTLLLAALCGAGSNIATADPAHPHDSRAVLATPQAVRSLPPSALAAFSFIEIVNSTAAKGLADGGEMDSLLAAPAGAWLAPGDPSFAMIAGAPAPGSLFVPAPAPAAAWSDIPASEPARERRVSSEPRITPKAERVAATTTEKPSLASPRPSGATLVLCGLLVVMFIARRVRAWMP